MCKRKAFSVILAMFFTVSLAFASEKKEAAISTNPQPSAVTAAAESGDHFIRVETSCGEVVYIRAEDYETTQEVINRTIELDQKLCGTEIIN